MMMLFPPRTVRPALLALWCAVLCVPIGRPAEPAAAEAAARGGVVFVGSSSIKRWTTVVDDFPGVPVVRGDFYGRHIAHCLEAVPRIVPLAPGVIVFYAGENDVADGKSTPEQTAADFGRFCAAIHAALPETRIVYVSIKPSPARWRHQPLFVQTNALAAQRCEQDGRLVYVDGSSVLLGEDGQPRPELFAPDRVHLNAAAYRLWIERLAPLLQQLVQPSRPGPSAARPVASSPTALRRSAA